MPELRAGWLVWMGLCEGSCLLAARPDCSCVCGGRYHGLLFDEVIGIDLSDYEDWEMNRVERGLERLVEDGLATLAPQA